MGGHRRPLPAHDDGQHRERHRLRPRLPRLAPLRRTPARAPRRLSLILVALVAAQIGLGGVTVLFKLPDLASTAHLVNALLNLAGLILLAEGTPGHAAVPPR